MGVSYACGTYVPPKSGLMAPRVRVDLRISPSDEDTELVWIAHRRKKKSKIMVHKKIGSDPLGAIPEHLFKF